MNTEKTLFKSAKKPILKTSALFLAAICASTALLPNTAFAEISNIYSIENLLEDDAFDKDFREARDFIDRGEWARAAEKFNAVINKYPGNKSLDAALYWLAFSYKKQNRLKEAAATLDRLLKEFSASSWVDDARVLQMETALPLGKIYTTQNGSTFPVNAERIFAPAPARTTASGTASAALSEYFVSAQPIEGFNSTPKVALDRADEVKIAAFQSLLAADPKRAIEVMGEILTGDSKASETLKQEVLRVLRSPRITRSPGMIFAAGGVNKQFTPLLRETLVKSFQRESSVKIRREIIFALAHINDEASINHLGQLYDQTSDKEIKKAIISSLGGSYGIFYQYGALAQAAGFSTNSTPNPARKIGFDKLFEIVSKEKDTELRRLAFSSLQKSGGWSENPQAIDSMARLYDGETDEEFKSAIINSLAVNKQPQASRKLIDIARNEKSDRLKLEAIYALRTSANPEVLKFLEDLIK